MEPTKYALILQKTTVLYKVVIVIMFQKRYGRFSAVAQIHMIFSRICTFCCDRTSQKCENKFANHSKTEQTCNFFWRLAIKISQD